MPRMLLKVYLLTSVFAAGAWAQSQVGGASLNGTITDASGAAVPKAKVTVKATERGQIVRSLESNDEGTVSVTSPRASG